MDKLLFFENSKICQVGLLNFLWEITFSILIINFSSTSQLDCDNMSHKCVVPKCSSTTKDGIGTGISWHKFPFGNEQLLTQWLAYIPRSNWEPTVWSKICSRHFDDACFTFESQDSRGRTTTVKKRRLKQGSLPTLFPDCPAYLSKATPKPRSELSSASSRRDIVRNRMEEQADAFLKSDEIQGYDDMCNRLLQGTHFPGNAFAVQRQDDFFIASSQHVEGSNVEYYIFGLSIKKDLSYQMFRKNISLSSYAVKHIVGKKMTSISEILNVVAWLNSESTSMPVRSVILDIVKELENCTMRDDVTEEQEAKLNFLLEQLQLAVTRKYARRYSPHLLATAMMWKCYSSSLYKHMVHQGTLTLPSVSRLIHLSAAFNMTTGLSDTCIKYFRNRITELCPKERTVIVLIDEVYVAQKLEFHGGKLYGYMDDKPAKTVLTFMVSSLYGKYRDVVAMYPQCSLSAKEIKEYFFRMLPMLMEIGFSVAGLGVDNYSANRTFFKTELCQGEFKTFVANPYNNNERIYLLIDAVHTMKNVYNNFLSKKMFECPPFCGQSIGKPKFEHIHKIYEMERGKPLKIAHKLSYKVLFPTAIQKTNVKLMDSFFHESTISALEYYGAHGHEEFLQSVPFFKLMRSIWNRLNVRTPTHGIQKRDETREPIYADDWQKIQYLKDISNWVETWGKNKTISR